MSGWIGVDLDGTLAEYHGWNDGVIGPPIPLMLERVRTWLSQGIEVRIVTARVAHPNQHGEKEKIQAWCLEHLGVKLTVTSHKDFQMIELWDDRAIRVEKNTGRVI